LNYFNFKFFKKELEDIVKFTTNHREISIYFYILKKYTLQTSFNHFSLKTILTSF
jgi:hypothetical protein